MKDKVMEVIENLNVLATDVVDLISTFAILEEEELKELNLDVIEKHLIDSQKFIDKVVDLLG